MAKHSASDYETLRQELEAARQGQRDAEEQQRRAEEQQRQAEEEREKARELTRETTFDEYIKACHSLLEVYNTVRSYLQPAYANAPRLFAPVLALQDLGRRLCSQPLSSEKDLEGVERYGKDDHVRDIVSALCRIPAAREMLRLGSGFRFDSHANALDEEATEARERDTASGRMQPDQFCVHRLDGDASRLLMTVEYKPPHKLSTENLCAGLRPMDFWEEVVNSETIPTERTEKLRYNATRLAGAAIVQEYHVMIQEGLAYSCIHRPSNLPKMAFDDATHAHILSAHLHRAYCWTKMIIRILQMPNRMLACPVINGTSARSPRRHRRRSPQFDVMYHQIRPEDTKKNLSTSAFCTQTCLLGLKHRRPLDNACPNVSDHRRGQKTEEHAVTAVEMVYNLKQQLDKDVDRHCEPFGECGSTGVPFKLRCESYGYTFVGKGTISSLWHAVSREAQFYQILHSAQGFAVPVFLGSIDMAQSYFLHGAGEIQHMLLMAWGGEPLTQSQWQDKRGAVKKSHARVRELGIRHGDVRRPNTLWNPELDRVLIIDFHKSELIKKETVKLKRKGEAICGSSPRRPRVTLF
ncbi:hypothetical protein KC340_g17889 [Hortaea werneckii]|nr:hypothetical protein KC340_g17889 [Hortaea werneckii]